MARGLGSEKEKKRGGWVSGSCSCGHSKRRRRQSGLVSRSMGGSGLDSVDVEFQDSSLRAWPNCSRAYSFRVVSWASMSASLSVSSLTLSSRCLLLSFSILLSCFSSICLCLCAALLSSSSFASCLFRWSASTASCSARLSSSSSCFRAHAISTFFISLR